MELKYIPYESIDHINVEYSQDELNNSPVTKIEIFTQKGVFLFRYVGTELITKLNTRIVFIQNGTSWTMTPLKFIEHLDGVNKIC